MTTLPPSPPKRPGQVAGWAELAPNSQLVDALYPSANIGERAPAAGPTHLILHYTGFSDAQSAIDWLAHPDSGVSCHYVIDTDGTVTQMVSETHRAWHAGQSYWAGEHDLNSWSVGIEIQNPGHDRGYPPFPMAQMEAVAALSRDIIARNRISADRVLAHSDIAPHRKIDPGEQFDWRWLADQGVGRWVAPAPLGDMPAGEGLPFGKLPVQLPADHPVFQQRGTTLIALQRLLARIGYNCPDSGEACPVTVAAIAAFQRRHRPARVDGLADAGTLATAEWVLG